MKELPEGLPPLPEGAVYAGRLQDYPRGKIIAGWALYQKSAEWIYLARWEGTKGCEYASGAWHIAVSADSEIARLNGSQESSKPSWDDAPDWAGWLAQDANGEWSWLGGECPYVHSDLDIWCPTSNYSKASQGQKNPNWRETLERRPGPTKAQNAALEELTKMGQEQGDYTLPPKLVIPYHLIHWSRVEGYIELGYRLEIDCDGLRGWCHD